MKTHTVLSKICGFLILSTAVLLTAQSVSAKQKYKAAELGVQSLQLICDMAAKNGRTTEVMLTNSGKDSALVVFEYRQPADKSGRTNPQSGLRYKVASKQSVALTCDDLLPRGNRESKSLAMTVSAQPFEGVGVIATYKSFNSASSCTSTILPIDNFNAQPESTHGTFCPGCPLDSKGICCNDLCCEGDCIDGACQVNSFTTVDDDG